MREVTRERFFAMAETYDKASEFLTMDQRFASGGRTLENDVSA